MLQEVEVEVEWSTVFRSFATLVPNFSSHPGHFRRSALGDEMGLRQGHPLALRITVGGLLCLGCLEERESWAPWLAFPFPQATQAL